MKKIFIAYFHLLIIMCCGQTSKKIEQNTQNQPFLQYSEINDSLQCSKININGIRITTNKIEFKNTIGQPDSVYKILDEEDTPVFEYEALVYGQSEFYFYKNSLFGFKLKDNKFFFDSIAVGRAVNIVEQRFPLSFKNLIHKKNNQLVIGCYEPFKNYLSPDRIVISYNESLITEIIAFIY